jgi:hypothetical protein
MSDVELEREETLTRHEAARRLSALASALVEGGDEIELELELRWSTAKAAEKPVDGDRRPPARRRLRRPVPAGDRGIR